MEKLKSLYVGSPPFLTVLGKGSCLTLNHQQEHIFAVPFLHTFLRIQLVQRLQSLSLSKILETPMHSPIPLILLCNVAEVTWLK